MPLQLAKNAERSPTFVRYVNPGELSYRNSSVVWWRHAAIYSHV